jgi:hypothetical protein
MGVPLILCTYVILNSFDKRQRGLCQQGWILVEIVGEVEKGLGEVQRSSSQPPWKVRA